MFKLMLTLSIVGLFHPVVAIVKVCADTPEEAHRGITSLRKSMPIEGAERLFSGPVRREGAMSCVAVHVVPDSWLHSRNFQHVAQLAASRNTVVIRLVDSSVPICTAELNSVGQLVKTSLAESKQREIKRLRQSGVTVSIQWEKWSLIPGLEPYISGMTLPPLPPDVLPDTQYDCNSKDSIFLYAFEGGDELVDTIAHEMTHAARFISGAPFQHCTKNVQRSGDSELQLPLGCASVGNETNFAEYEASHSKTRVGEDRLSTMPVPIANDPPDGGNGYTGKAIFRMSHEKHDSGDRNAPVHNNLQLAVTNRRRRDDELLGQDEAWFGAASRTNIPGTSREERAYGRRIKGNHIVGLLLYSNWQNRLTRPAGGAGTQKPIADRCTKGRLARSFHADNRDTERLPTDKTANLATTYRRDQELIIIHEGGGRPRDRGRESRQPGRSLVSPGLCGAADYPVSGCRPVPGDLSVD